MRTRHSLESNGCLQMARLVLTTLTGTCCLPCSEQPVYRYLCGCGAIYSSLTRISSGIFASRRVMVFTITQVLHRAL